MLTTITIILGLYFFCKAVKYFCLALFRFFLPMFIIIYSVDKAYESELKRTDEYKKFEDELNNLL